MRIPLPLLLDPNRSKASTMLTLGIFLCLLVSMVQGQNPCDPNPCGPNTRCLTRPGSDRLVISCECKEGKIEFSMKKLVKMYSLFTFWLISPQFDEFFSTKNFKILISQILKSKSLPSKTSWNTQY